MSNYLINTKAVTEIPKSGSSSLALLSFLSSKPQGIEINGVPLRDNTHLVSDIWFHKQALRADDAQEAAVFVREPKDRFTSAMHEEGLTDVDATLDALEAGEVPHHLQSTTSLINAPVSKLFKFPEHITELLTYISEPEFPASNVAAGDKPVLTTTQATRVEAYYAEDVALYNSITVAGQELVTEPEPEPVYVPTEVTNYQVKQALNANPADRQAVDAFVAASGDQNVIDGWQYASSFKKDHPLFLGAVAYLGWSQQKVDDLLILAATFD